MRPETRYARSDGLYIAYQVLGAGPPDIVFVPAWVSNLEHWWTHPLPERFFRRLADFSRLILFDGRGIGLSDPGPHVPTLEERVDDLFAVMDRVGSDRAVLYGHAESATVAALAASTHPRPSAVVDSPARSSISA